MDISVIVPFYKGNQYMEQLFGVVSRNATNAKDLSIELLLVNDSPNIPVEYSDTWVKGFTLRIINNLENVGIQKTRVNGLQYAEGQFIQFLDQDDTLTDEALISQYSLIGDADIILANGINENRNAEHPIYRTLSQQRMATKPRFYYTVSNQIASPGQCLIRKEAIPTQWYESCIGRNGSDDLLLWFMLFHSNAVWAVNPKCVYTHKNTGINLSDDIEKMVESSQEVLRVLQKYSMISKRQTRQFINCRKMARNYIGKGIVSKLFAIIFHPVIFWNRLLLRIYSR